MIGVVVVTHGRLGAELIKTAEFILGRIENVLAVSIDDQRSPDALRAEIEQAVKTVDKGNGVLILTDMFGGTPSNLSLSLLSNGRIEVLSGVNLPMLIKLIQCRSQMKLTDLAQTVSTYARNSINVAGQLLGPS